MKIIYGNILEIKQGIICHQVNCQRKAGAGLALAIRTKWPYWFKEFSKYKNPMLGDILMTAVGHDLFVASLYAQENYGTDGRQTDYRALRTCFHKLRDEQMQIYIPFKIGCGLGGGMWIIVSRIIEEELPMAVVVKLFEPVGGVR